jgi:cytidylate kinase
MAEWQTAWSSSTGDAGHASASHHHWPDFFVRWLFGRGDEPRVTREVSGAAVRFRNIGISREAGAGAGTIARMVGKRLGWKVYNEELVEAIAHRMEVSLDEVRTLDELAPSVVQDWLLPLREEYYAPQEAYLDHLAKLIEAIGRAGESILVGRGANYMLPRESILAVRIIAPLKVRAIRLAERMGVSVRTARRAARDLDRRRLHFDRTMFRTSSSDPHNFDLVLDSESLGLEMAAEILVRAIEAGRPRGPVKPERSLSASEIWGAPLPGLAPATPPDTQATPTNEAASGPAMDL